MRYGVVKEVLFRAKTDNGEWVEGFYVKCRRHHYILPIYDNQGFDERYADWIEVEEETICQYTGLTDKNGRMIFEGDVLRFVNRHNNHKWLCTVEFLKGDFICRYIEHDGFGECNHFCSWHEKVEWEVIGNVFDNPELLEVNGEDADPAN